MQQKFKALRTLALAAVISAGVIPGAAVAQEFPNGPIEVINNSKPGGGSDIFLRFATEKAAEILGTEFIHLSKTGGVATNTLKYVMSRPADGQTLFIVNAGTALTMMRQSVELSMDDIIPLVRGTVEPNFLVAKTGKYADAAAFIEAAQNGTIKQGGTNVGGNPHVEALILRNGIGMKNQVYVPFEQTGEIIINMVKGNIDVALLNFEEFESQWKAGEVEPLAIMQAERTDNAPDVPTGYEVGMPMEFATVRGIGVLSGTPEPVIAKLEAALIESMHSETYLKYLEGTGQSEASIAGREVFTAAMKKLNDEYTSVAEELKLVGN